MATTFTAHAAQEVNTTTAGDQVGAQCAVLPNGGHVVAWSSNGNVVAQVFDASGARSGGEVTLLAGYGFGGIAALADGTLVVSGVLNYQDSDFHSRTALYFERVDTSGRVLMGPTLVDDTGNYDVWVSGGEVYAMPGGGFAITDIHTTRPTPLSSISQSIRVYDGAGNFVAAVPGSQHFAQETTQLRGGGFVTEGNTNFGPTPVSSSMWRSNDAQGNTVASQALAGQFGQTGYDEGGVVGLADGRGLVVWHFTQYDGSVAGAAAHAEYQAQWLDASGRPSGGVFTFQSAAPYGLHLTALAGGGFVATWSQGTGYNMPVDLYAQHYDASARPDSGAVRLATFSFNDTGHDITATPDGGFILHFGRVGDGKDVWEQKFDVVSVPEVSAATTSRYPGIDEVSYPGAHNSYSIDITAQGAWMTGPNGTVDLSGIERVRFSEGHAVALDVNGHAGYAYRLYQAAFDRAPDLAGLGFHINDLDMGTSLYHVADNFIYSAEFQSKYGAGLGNGDFVTLLYQHVLHRDPEAGGFQWHVDQLAHGGTRAETLVHFSESAENIANLVGVIGDGMLFIPYA